MSVVLEPQSKPKRRRPRPLNPRGVPAPAYLTYQEFLNWLDEDTHGRESTYDQPCDL